jgi:hypothetical protein
MVAQGLMAGPDQPVELRLLDLYVRSLASCACLLAAQRW